MQLVFTFSFHQAAGRALVHLHLHGILRSTELWHEVVARWTRWFGTLPLLLFPLILGLSLATQPEGLEKSYQAPPRMENRNGNLTIQKGDRVTNVGFVQSPRITTSG